MKSKFFSPSYCRKNLWYIVLNSVGPAVDPGICRKIYRLESWEEIYMLCYVSVNQDVAFSVQLHTSAFPAHLGPDRGFSCKAIMQHYPTDIRGGHPVLPLAAIEWAIFPRWGRRKAVWIIKCLPLKSNQFLFLICEQDMGTNNFWVK